MISTEASAITGHRCRRIDGLSSGFLRTNRTIESAQDQTLRAQASGITGPQFLSALRAVWHLEQSCRTYFKPFPPYAVTSSPAIPYSWQVSRIRTDHLMINPKGNSS